jgi:hypothetical protein
VKRNGKNEMMRKKKKSRATISKSKARAQERWRGEERSDGVRVIAVVVQWRERN